MLRTSVTAFPVFLHHYFSKTRVGAPAERRRYPPQPPDSRFGSYPMTRSRDVAWRSRSAAHATRDDVAVAPSQNDREIVSLPRDPRWKSNRPFEAPHPVNRREPRNEASHGCTSGDIAQMPLISGRCRAVISGLYPMRPKLRNGQQQTREYTSLYLVSVTRLRKERILSISGLNG